MTQKNKEQECKKCGRVFGSVRCFDIDCPNNTPKITINQEEKDLLVKDLCARLPYEVKVQYEDGIFTLDHISAMYEEVKLNTPNSYTIGVLEVKPYLFPIESMTKVQEDEWYESFIDPLSKRIDRHTRQEDLQLQADAQAFGIEYLLKNHFDIYGLIPMGLALNATELNIY